MILTFAWLGGGRARTVVWATDRRLCSFTGRAMIGLPQMNPNAQTLIQEQDTAEGVKGKLIQCHTCVCPVMLPRYRYDNKRRRIYACLHSLACKHVAIHNTRIIRRDSEGEK